MHTSENTNREMHIGNCNSENTHRKNKKHEHTWGIQIGNIAVRTIQNWKNRPARPQ